MGKYEELEKVLKNSKGEREVGKYLKENLILIKNTLNIWSWNCVICKPEFKIGTKYVADYLILSANSGCWNAVMIEMQSHRDRILLQDGTASKGLRVAQKQIQEWEMWIESYNTEFRGYLAELAKDELAQCSNVMRHIRADTELRDPKTVIRYKYKILIGRRDYLSEDINNRKNHFGNTEIVTFDRVLDYAKKRDEDLKGKGRGLDDLQLLM